MKSLIERLKIEADYEDENGDLRDVLRDAIAAIEAAERALEPFGKVGDWLGPRPSRLHPDQRSAQVYMMSGGNDDGGPALPRIFDPDFRQASEALKLIRSSPSSAQADPQADQAASRGEL